MQSVYTAPASIAMESADDNAAKAENGYPPSPQKAVAQDPQLVEFVRQKSATTSLAHNISQELSPHQSKVLRTFHREKMKKHMDSINEFGHVKHHGKDPSIITAVISGVINWLLMFGLCCAYGMILFSDDWHLSHRTMGVKMNLFTACFVGLVVAIMSKIPVAIGGPDLNPVVFLASFVDGIGQSIASQHGLDYPTGEDDEFKFCDGEHLQANSDACEIYHLELRATVMFATAISSAILGLLFFCLGRFRLTRFVAYVPTSIMEAFLACVGYKVFKYALKFSKFQPRQFIPAALIGVSLYFVKALHIGNPAVMIPLFLFVPLGIFYCIIYASGSDLIQARSDGLMFPEMPDISFWTVWTEGFGNADDINFEAYSSTMADLIIMIVVVLLDCLLKLAGTETKLGLAVDKDYEISLYGASNLLTTCSFSSVGYMQLKFNVINYGVMGNLVDRRGGITYAILCGVTFFGTIQPFNFMPRFFLSLLLFFAGSGFVAENLWGSRQYLRMAEWMQICVILAVFVLSEKLLYAVAAGALLTCITFVSTCAGVPCLLGTNLKGGDMASSDRHERILQRNLEHITNSWLMVIRLKGYVFFGSSQSLLALVRSKINEQKQLPRFRRLRYVIFDCKMLDGLDASASRGMRVLEEDAKAYHIQFLWSHIDHHRSEELKKRQLLVGDSAWFLTLNDAVSYVEAHALQYVQEIQVRWLSAHPALALYQRVVHEQDAFDPFRQILTMDTTRHGCPWLYCSKVRLEQHKTLLWEPGQMGVHLFLVHTGAVGLFTSLPEDDNGHDDTKKKERSSKHHSPVAIYRHGWFLNPDALARSCTQFYAVALEDGEAVSWDESQWYRMTHERPAMASAISKAVLNQKNREWELLEKQAERVVTADDEHDSDLLGNGSYDDTSAKEDEADARLRLSQHSLQQDMKDIPAEVQNLFAQLHTAQVLEERGFFASSADAVDPPLLPSLPRRFLSDLEIAFDTYCQREQERFLTPRSGELNAVIPRERQPNNRATGEAKIPSADVMKALKYAGVTTAVLRSDNCVGDLNYTDFLRLGRCALMALMNTKQVASSQQVFQKYDVDGSGELTIAELEPLLKETFHPFISIEEAVSIEKFWDEDRSGMIDIDEFTELVSRLVRQCEQEWSVLTALRELLGDKMADLARCMTVEDLCKNSYTSISEEEAREMMWVADWRTSGSGAGSFLQLCDIPAFLLLHLENVKGDLPPLPPEKYALKSKQKLEVKSQRDKVYRRSGSCTGQIAPGDATQFVVDLRDQEAREQVLMTVCPRTSSGANVNLFTLMLNSRASDQQLGLIPQVSPESEESLQKAPDCKRRLFLFLNNPTSSKAAGVWCSIAIGSVCLSIVTLFVEQLASGISDSVWFGLEVYITAFFTIELLLRLAVADEFHGFFTNVRTLCDLVAVLPFYLELVFSKNEKWWEMLRINRIVRLFRLLRVIRIINVRGLSSAVGAIVTILAVIWGIYLKYSEGTKK